MAQNGNSGDRVRCIFLRPQPAPPYDCIATSCEEVAALQKRTWGARMTPGEGSKICVFASGNAAKWHRKSGASP
eukprot:492054-Pyramimonas_sp.AAC.2